MKKLLVILIVFSTIFSLTACAVKKGTNSDVSSEKGSAMMKESLEDILSEIYKTAKIENAQEKDFLTNSLVTTPINETNCEYQLGKADINFEKAIASEAQMGGAYALCLVRVKKDADIESIKKIIKDNVDPMKWVCMGVKEENIIVDSIDDVIILIMSDTSAKPLHDAFLALK